ncbi:MAG TPA: hypothetical protein VG963_10285 [Polyangiaceae bacterium]|nr:hypothetical protein [Polyangiaceae bacterium]
MPRYYRHRVNSLTELASVPEQLGIEFDLRSDGDRVIVTHDPFTEGPTIEEFLSLVGGRPCIFNVKCEGIEGRVLELAQRHDIRDFFFLDCSAPAAFKLWRSGEHRFAVRWSEHEPLEGALAWAGKAAWCWVDCFSAYPDDADAWAQAAQHFQLCVVSPELQGHGVEAIGRFRSSLRARPFHAVCTKRPDLWTV